MEEKILAEIQGIRSLLAIIVGTENQPREIQFSSASLDKAQLKLFHPGLTKIIDESFCLLWLLQAFRHHL
jgi:hypothetical protein